MDKQMDDESNDKNELDAFKMYKERKDKINEL